MCLIRSCKTAETDLHSAQAAIQKARDDKAKAADDTRKRRAVAPGGNKSKKNSGPMLFTFLNFEPKEGRTMYTIETEVKEGEASFQSKPTLMMFKLLDKAGGAAGNGGA